MLIVYIQDNTAWQSHYSVHRAKDSARSYEVYEVPASDEEVERWESAHRLWLRAQQEMQAKFQEASAIEDAVSAIEEELADREYEKQEQERRAAQATQEALADQLDGPREWMVHTRHRETDRGALKTVGYTVHHQTCGVLQRALQGPHATFTDRRPHRMPELASLVLRGFYDGRPIKTCRCARRMQEAAESLRREQAIEADIATAE